MAHYREHSLVQNGSILAITDVWTVQKGITDRVEIY